MAAEVHAIPAVVDGLGYTADLGFRFEHDRRDVRASQHLERSGQPGWSGARNDCDVFLRAHTHSGVRPIHVLAVVQVPPSQMPGR